MTYRSSSNQLPGCEGLTELVMAELIE